MTASGIRALFLDRDGTIIRDVGYPRDPAQVELLPGAAEGLLAAQAMGFALVIVSNQSGVARGLIRPEEARAVQGRLEELCTAHGIELTGAFFCFHGPKEGCACRKPAPGMILEASRAHGIDRSSSIMVGDKPSDVDAGVAAGCRAVAFGSFDHPLAAERVASWAELVVWLAESGLGKS
jgi:D-glycero-D-manno-heptose 1,7-bisphosphate phosphatase